MSSAPLSVKPDQPVTAALRMGGAVLAFSLMAVAARQVSHRHDSFEILTYRSGIGLGLVLIYARATGQTASITTDRLSGHFLRNIVHFVGQNLWFTALTMIPLAQLFALEFTAPIWVILLAPLFLGEALTRPRLWSAALGFAGIMIVARPNLTVLDAGVLAAAGAAVCFAAVSILTKRLTTGQSVTAILFWLTLMQLGFGLITALWDGQMRLPDAQTLPWLVVIGGCGVVAHLSLTSALSLAPASFVAPIDFIRLPLIAVVGAVFYQEPLDPYVLGGAAVIFAGIWLNIRSEIRQRALQPL